jgi:hypothetical protein
MGAEVLVGLSGLGTIDHEVHFQERLFRILQHSSRFSPHFQFIGSGFLHLVQRMVVCRLSSQILEIVKAILTIIEEMKTTQR